VEVMATSQDENPPYVVEATEEETEPATHEVTYTDLDLISGKLLGVF
jgi:hypothetical protein